MNRQRITPASLTSPAANSARKGLQQYCTPQEWATALGAGLPPLRRTICDPCCGNGSLVRGLANDTTRDALGLDLDPTASLGGDAAWAATPAARCHRHLAHGDLLDLLPLIEDTGIRFDLLALNPPFSLDWPLALLPAPLRAGIKGKTLSSTHATLRLASRYLSARGEAVLIGNAATLAALKERHPADFAKVWLHMEVPSFFPGVDESLQVGLLYLAGGHADGPGEVFAFPGIHHPSALAQTLETLRQAHFTSPCIEEYWHADADSAKAWLHCTDELTRRANPSAAKANIVVDTEGRLRIWISGFQQRSLKVPRHLTEFLRRVHRAHPVELTIQPATRLALTEALDSGLFTIDPPAEAAIRTALGDFQRDRAPLAALSGIQRLGWLDDSEALLCTRDFHCFRAGEAYPISSQTVEWKKTVERPRYRAGVRDKEDVLTKGTDLEITLHGPENHRFTYCPANLAGIAPDRSAGLDELGGLRHHTLEDLAAHFQIPEVLDITTVFPDAYQANLALIDQLESITP